MVLLGTIAALAWPATPNASETLKPERVKLRASSSFRWRRLEGYPVLPWTVAEAAEAARLIALGCEGVVSNRPQELAEFIKN